MTCVVAPAAAAIVVAAVRKKIPEKYHPNWLLAMLFGGVTWLIAEHIYHGEMVLYPPFFTAGIREIIPEILTTGIYMVALAIIFWLLTILFSSFPKRYVFRPSALGLMVFGAMIMIFADKIFA